MKTEFQSNLLTVNIKQQLISNSTMLTYMIQIYSNNGHDMGKNMCTVYIYICYLYELICLAKPQCKLSQDPNCRYWFCYGYHYYCLFFIIFFLIYIFVSDIIIIIIISIINIIIMIIINIYYYIIFNIIIIKYFNFNLYKFYILIY